jgi:non-specific protein-tyrosine kinase
MMVTGLPATIGASCRATGLFQPVPELQDRVSTPPEVPGLVQALRVLRERWWVIAICGVVALLSALVYVERQPRQYTATAKLEFTSNNIPSQVAGVPETQSIDPEGEKATNLQLVTATPVAAQVVKTLKLDTTPAELLEEVTASNPNNDYIVDVSFTDAQPQRAAEIANTFAEQYVVYSQKEKEAQLVRGEQLINQKLAQLPAEDTADRTNLRNLSQKLLLLQAVQTGNAKVVGIATVPGSPSSPKVKSTVLIALIVGLLLGVGLAFLLNLIDRRIKSLEELEQQYDLPALASIPQLPHRMQTAREFEPALEPFRILHNGLALVGRGKQVKIVLVTSAVASEGKTTVAIGLGRAAALSGQRVILIDADLRRPSLGAKLGLANGRTRGLTSALFNDENALDLLNSPPEDVDQLQVLTSGPVPLHASDMLRSDRLASVFATLASEADLVVIDAAPLLPVVDTRTLLDEVMIDACLLVGRVGTTTRDQVRRVRTVLDRRKLSGVGLVVNDPTETGSSYYGYNHDSVGSDAETHDGPDLSGLRLSRPKSTRRH